MLSLRQDEPKLLPTSTHRLRLGLPGYLIPFAPLAFVHSASVSTQEIAFATGVPLDICRFHSYTQNSISLYRTLV